MLDHMERWMEVYITSDLSLKILIILVLSDQELESTCI
jgi:hypothetical protein